MKVKVSVTLDVDPEKWAYEFGIERTNVRDDVKNYFSIEAEDKLRFLGLGVNDE